MCIDPRFVNPTNIYMQQRGLTDDYSQFGLAGAAAGVVTPAFASWHDTFWENLDASVQLHQINAVIAVDHRDCGAAHEEILGALRDGVLQRHPELAIETWLMALDGSTQRIGA